jgi:hypothetical protein
MNAQLQNSNWNFGNKVGLNFSNNTILPTQLSENKMSTTGGVASVSDNDGNLLFYTDGITVWNYDDKIVKNGNGLYGSKSVSQSVIIVPIPDEEDKFYIITNQGQEVGSLGLHYTIIDMSKSKDDDDDNADKEDNNEEDYEYCNDLHNKVNICHNGHTICVSVNAIQAHLNHGDKLGSCDDENNENDEDNSLGYIKKDEKNIPLLSHSGNQLTAVFNKNTKTYCIVVLAPSVDPKVSDTFYAFNVDKTGINLMNESSFSFDLPQSDQTGGQMKISPDLKTLAIVNNTNLVSDRYGILEYGPSVYTFDFDIKYGSVKNLDTGLLLDSNNSSYYGLEFSPDSNLLYVTSIAIISDQNKFPVHEIAQGSLIQVPYRNLSQENLPTRIYEGPDPIFGLQLGMNGKIYVMNSSGNLSVINEPNIEGFGASYERETLLFQENNGTKELPQLVPVIYSIQNKAAVNDIAKIIGNPITDELILKFKYNESYKINIFNTTGSLVQEVQFNTARKNKKYIINTTDLPSGLYYVTVSDSNGHRWHQTIIKS